MEKVTGTPRSTLSSGASFFAGPTVTTSGVLRSAVILAWSSLSSASSGPTHRQPESDKLSLAKANAVVPADDAPAPPRLISGR
nr:unnamed protein product [Digitaria exilis]